MAFCGYIKQSATPTIVLGPFLDSTDGVTAKTAASPVPKLSKNGAAFAARSDATAIVHMENGYYTVVLNATDTGTLGLLAVGGTGTASLPVRQDYMVVTGQEYDRMHLTTGSVASLGILDRGTATAATSTTLVIAASSTFADSTLVGATLMVFGSTQNYWQSRSVTAYTASTFTATVDAFTVTPSGTISYLLLAGAPSSATNVPSVNVVKIAGQTASAAATVTFPGTIASTTNITAGTVTTATNVTTVNGLAANVITAASLATDAATEIANATVEAEITAVKSYSRTANEVGTITGPTSGSTALGITTDATYLPIKTL